MSREIKFRLHCADTGKILAYEKFNTSLNWGYCWYDATLPEDDQICETSNYFRHQHPLGKVIRVEFTGLRDSNGVEVFEGDVLECEDHFYYEISWSDKHHCWWASDIGGLDELPESAIVIGNIYQNKNLLEKGNE